MASLDPARLRSTIKAAMGRGIPNLDTCACGEAPVLAAMEAARRLGAKAGHIISYANSGRTALGGEAQVVGYGAIAFTKDAEAAKEPFYSDTFTQAERELSSPSRESVTRAVTTQTAPLARVFGENLQQKRGVFVTLKKGGELRGCIGHTEPDTPLGRLVGTMAISAALADPRFRPVSARELPEIDIGISVLTRHGGPWGWRHQNREGRRRLDQRGQIGPLPSPGCRGATVGQADSARQPLPQGGDGARMLARGGQVRHFSGHSLRGGNPPAVMTFAGIEPHLTGGDGQAHR